MLSSQKPSSEEKAIQKEAYEKLQKAMDKIKPFLNPPPATSVTYEDIWTSSPQSICD